MSLLFLVVLGSVFVRYRSSNPVGQQTISSMGVSSIAVKPDISVYTQAAVAVITGKVGDISNNYTNVDVKEVLKGDAGMTNMNVLVHRPADGELTSEDSAVLNPGENVLLFLCKNSSGDYVVCGEAAGKCLIDKDNNVIGDPAFTMPLAELEAKIRVNLSAPQTR